MAEYNTPPINTLEIDRAKDTTIPGNGIAPDFHFEEVLKDETTALLDPDDKGCDNAVKLTDFDYLRITKEKNIPHPDPIIIIDGAAVAAPGNLTGVSAQIKAGKTSIVGVFMAACLSSTGQADGFDSIKCIPCDGKAIIGPDTEQSDADQQDNLNNILRRVGLDKTPDNLRLYNFRQLNMDNYQKVTDDICRLCSEEFGGIHLILIDGGADYIADVNNTAQSRAIIEYFTHLSIKYNCAVIIVVHTNPGTDKERGHFGSELQRKCYGLITIEKDLNNDVSILKPKAFRKAGNGDISPIHFKYDKEKGYHIQVEAVDSETIRAAENMEKHRQIAREVFEGQKSLTYTNAVSEIMGTTKRGERTAKEMIKNMAGWKFIVKGTDGNYRLYTS